MFVVIVIPPTGVSAANTLFRTVLFPCAHNRHHLFLVNIVPGTELSSLTARPCSTLISLGGGHLLCPWVQEGKGKLRMGQSGGPQSSRDVL